MDAQLKRGLIEACILKLLTKGDSYGYQLVREAEEVLSISESTLYPVLRRLETAEDLSYYGIHYYARPYAEVNRDRWHMGAERRIDQVNIWVVSPEQWSELLKRYDYVYVLNADEYLQETYGDMTDKAFEPRTIYKVLNEDGKVRLVSSGIDLYN